MSAGRGNTPWRVAEEPPPTAPKPAPARPQPETAEVLRLALGSGMWVMRQYTDERDAMLTWRRVRYQVTTHHRDKMVRSRREKQENGTVILWIKIEPREAK